MPGDDLLFHRLSDSTIGAVGFHGRVRDGIGWDTDAMVTRQRSRCAGGALRLPVEKRFKNRCILFAGNPEYRAPVCSHTFWRRADHPNRDDAGLPLSDWPSVVIDGGTLKRE